MIVGTVGVLTGCLFCYLVYLILPVLVSASLVIDLFVLDGCWVVVTMFVNCIVCMILLVSLFVSIL